MCANPRRAGRKGSLEEARALVALVSSLSEAGDALTVEAVSSGLSVSAERAEKLIGLVLTSSAGDGARLPLVEGADGREVTLLLSEGMRGRRLRLDRKETLALAAALERLGVPESDPLRSRLEGALSPGGLDRDLVRRVIDPTADGGETAARISECARALLVRGTMTFEYRREGAADAEARHVMPKALRHEGGTWYLDAFDLGRGCERTFRLDRMGPVGQLGRTADKPARPVSEQPARTVLIDFADPRYLDLLPLHDLKILERREDGSVRAATPYYGGSWLPRMLAACAGTASTTDPELATRTLDYVQKLLG